MLSPGDWREFEETAGWREVIETVKDRMRLVNQDILNPLVCNSEEKRIGLQQEYLTCLWFLNIPKIDAPKEETDEDLPKDNSVAPDLSPFRV
jgi:hypothetical protein